MDDGITRAPVGCIYVCLACGRTSPTRYGLDKQERNIAMPGWDSSCMMNCALLRVSDIDEQKPSGRVTRVRAGATEVVLEATGAGSDGSGGQAQPASL